MKLVMGNNTVLSVTWLTNFSLPGRNRFSLQTCSNVDYT